MLEKSQENYKFKSMENEEVFLRGEIDKKELEKIKIFIKNKF